MNAPHIRIASAAGRDAGNRSMRAAGRTAWNADDWNADDWNAAAEVAARVTRACAPEMLCFYGRPERLAIIRTSGGYVLSAWGECSAAFPLDCVIRAAQAVDRFIAWEPPEDHPRGS